MINEPLYRLTPDARSDLIEIRKYTLTQWGKEPSGKYVSGIRQTIKILSETPRIGKQQQDTGDNVFNFPYASHVIYYTLHNKQRVVFAILHKRMTPLSHLHDQGII